MSTLHPTRTRVRATLKLKPNPAAAAPAPLVLDGDGLTLRRRSRSTARRSPPTRYVATPDGLTIAQPPHRPFTLEIETLVDPHRQHQADGPLPLERHLLHPVRGGGLPPHHLFPRPARRDGGLHHAHRGRQGRGAGAALQRQPASKPATCPDGRHFAVWHDPFPKPVLSVRAGRRRSRLRRGQLHHHVRPQGRAAHLCRARQGGPLPATPWTR